MVVCEKCGSPHIAKKGFRYNKSIKKQKYQCSSCHHWFVEDDGFKRMRHNPKVIVRAIHQFSDGFSLGKVKNHLNQHDNTKISRWTIRNWVVKYELLLKKNLRNSAFQRLRGKSISTKKESM